LVPDGVVLGEGDGVESRLLGADDEVIRIEDAIVGPGPGV
jgi:hypothetical protein